MEKNTFRKLLAGFLTLCMALTVLPMSARAEASTAPEGATVEGTTITVTTTEGLYWAFENVTDGGKIVLSADVKIKGTTKTTNDENKFADYTEMTEPYGTLYLEKGQTVTLDVAGHSIMADGFIWDNTNNLAVIGVRGNSNLTIVNSSDKQGIISSLDKSNDSSAKVVTNGKTTAQMYERES